MCLSPPPPTPEICICSAICPWAVTVGSLRSHSGATSIQVLWYRTPRWQGASLSFPPPSLVLFSAKAAFYAYEDGDLVYLPLKRPLWSPTCVVGGSPLASLFMLWALTSLLYPCGPRTLKQEPELQGCLCSTHFCDFDSRCSSLKWPGRSLLFFWMSSAIYLFFFNLKPNFLHVCLQREQ